MLLDNDELYEVTENRRKKAIKITERVMNERMKVAEQESYPDSTTRAIVCGAIQGTANDILEALKREM